MLYIGSLELLNCITENLYPLANILKEDNEEKLDKKKKNPRLRVCLLLLDREERRDRVTSM